MKFTVEETNLMCIYGTDSRTELIKELEEMQMHLQNDEVELVDLTRSTLKKLKSMSDEDFEEIRGKLVADFE